MTLFRVSAQNTRNYSMKSDLSNSSEYKNILILLVRLITDTQIAKLISEFWQFSNVYNLQFILKEYQLTWKQEAGKKTLATLLMRWQERRGWGWCDSILCLVELDLSSACLSVLRMKETWDAWIWYEFKRAYCDTAVFYYQK